MKLYWKGAWLGWTVLISMVVLGTSAAMDPMSNSKHWHPSTTYWIAGLVMFVSFWIWVIRGVVRFLGRAWHHSVTKTKA